MPLSFLLLLLREGNKLFEEGIRPRHWQVFGPSHLGSNPQDIRHIDVSREIEFAVLPSVIREPLCRPKEALGQLLVIPDGISGGEQPESEPRNV
jgi:hypothetical protein